MWRSIRRYRAPMNLHLSKLPRLLAERRSSAILGVVIIVILWLGVFLKYAEDVRGNLQEAERIDRNYAMVFEENVLRTIDEVDNTLLYLRRNVETEQRTTDYNTIVRSTDIFSDIIVQVAIIDSHGTLRASNVGPDPTVQIDLHDRPHFLAHLRSDKDFLFISEPMVGRVSGKWSIQLSRRFLNADGSFGGVVVASLDPQHFTTFYDAVDLGYSGSIALIGDDGVVRSAGGQSSDLKMGQNMRGTKLFARMQNGLNSAFEEPDTSTAQTRLFALRKVSGQPLWVSVSLDKREALAGSRANLRVNGIIAALLTLIILAAMEWMFRIEAAARQKSRQLELTLESMSQGIMLVTKDLAIPIINKKCGELLKLPDAFVERPPRFDRLVEYRRSHLAASAGKFLAPAGESDSPLAPWHRPIDEWTMPDGTVLEVRSGHLADGGWVQTFTDITKRVRAEAHIARLASEDSLTGLLNRRGFGSALGSIPERPRAQIEPPDRIEYAVLFLDLDRFKVINDTLGHRIGDLLLQETALRLQDCLQPADVLARLGGDEFAVIARSVATRAALGNLAQRLIEAVREPFDLAGHQVRTTISIGIAVSAADGESADDLVVAADLALYAAKERNRDSFEFYQPAMTSELRDRQQIETELREAIDRNELELHYQPIVRLQDDSVTGFEALARWRHPTRGFVPPADFIPVAEDTGMITRLGEWALTEACGRIAQLPAHVNLAVNISPVQFAAPDLVEVVQRALASSGLPAERLELEITERLLVDNNERIVSMLRRLRQIGIRIALDDFGTGYSALSYLRKFPLDRIKIDRSFVTDMAARSDQLAIIQAVLAIARALGMSVTAEGVETAIQKDFLKALGCDSAQGYLFGKPVPFDELAEILAAQAAKKAMAA
jgi:diguanylate cyclase (GGDEF)-like protein